MTSRSGWNLWVAMISRWVWVEPMGVASGCGHKEIDFLILPIPTTLVSANFFH